jgi:sensitive to high expression protein 9
MQPIARFAPRLFFNAIADVSTKGALRVANRQVLRPSICLQCKIRTERRLFSDFPKPHSSNTIPSNTTSSKPSAESSTPKQDDSYQNGLSEDFSSELPSAEEGRRLAISKRFSKLMDHVQGNIFVASQRINDLTGYSGIEALKERITILEKRVSDAQELVRSSRLTYKTTVADRASTQREVTTLLARKDSWTPSDLERFTALYRMDHSNEQAVSEAATRLADAEREAEHSASKLSSSILSRYHEEQIWSDKIRRMSTWGTWGLMGVNVLLFLIFQLGFEPWRRRRLVHGFEEKVREALEKEKVAAQMRHESMEAVEPVSLDAVVAAGVEELQEEADSGAKTLEPAVDAVVACIKGQEGQTGQQEEAASLDSAELHVPTALMRLRAQQNSWTAAIQDLFSDRTVELRKQDITMIALESAATGAVIVTIIATIIFRHA